MATVRGLTSNTAAQSQLELELEQTVDVALIREGATGLSPAAALITAAGGPSRSARVETSAVSTCLPKILFRPAESMAQSNGACNDK